MDNGAAIPIPDGWDDMTDEQKDAVTADLLKAVADANGIDRGQPDDHDDDDHDHADERPSRTFTMPEE